MLWLARGLPGWQVCGQIAQFPPCLGRESGVGPVVELLKVKATDRVCITEHLSGALPIAV
jgi:hypothetical protein